MDVHAPHEPIHGVKDFLLHLLTITVGLLIAVGIEGCVELHREHKLVREARATMREEIEGNTKHMDEAVKDLSDQKTAIDGNIKILTTILRDPKDKDAQDSNIKANFSIVSLEDTAWKTAQTTGALTFMPYAEAEKYSSVYGTQHDFLAQQDKILEDEAQFIGVIRKLDFGNGTVTKEQASATLERFGVWQAHLSYLLLAAKVTTANNHAFLEGKAGPTEMQMQLK